MTDIIYFEYLQDMENANKDQCTLTWKPDVIPEESVGKSTSTVFNFIVYYLTELQKVWPYHLYYYQEEVALHYLHLKNYDVPLALMTASYNVDQLIQLLTVIRRKRRVQGLITNILMRQN